MRTQISQPARSRPKMELLCRLSISPWMFGDPVKSFAELQTASKPGVR